MRELVTACDPNDNGVVQYNTLVDALENSRKAKSPSTTFPDKKILRYSRSPLSFAVNQRNSRTTSIVHTGKRCVTRYPWQPTYSQVNQLIENQKKRKKSEERS